MKNYDDCRDIRLFEFECNFDNSMSELEELDLSKSSSQHELEFIDQQQQLINVLKEEIVRLQD